MATQQMQVMVRNLRAECGHSLQTAQGVNQVDTLKYLLARTQEELWTAFVWPDLMSRRNVSLVAGQYLYPFPADMGFDMIRESWVSSGGNNMWGQLDYGIDEDRILPDGTNTERSDPVRAWDIDESGQFRVWPTPNAPNGWVRFKGNKPLAPFSADNDVSTLDATVIVLFAAADLLARAKAEDAASKAQKAQRHLTKLLGNKVSAKNKIVAAGAGSPNARSLPSGLTRSSQTWYG